MQDIDWSKPQWFIFCCLFACNFGRSHVFDSLNTADVWVWVAAVLEMELIQQQLSQLLLSKQSVKALVAIRFLPLLLERSLVQLFQAEAADEMLGMEFTEHGCDTAS